MPLAITIALCSALLVLSAVTARTQELFTYKTVVTGLAIPWEIHVDDDGMFWVTERKGLFSRIDPKTGEKSAKGKKKERDESGDGNPDSPGQGFALGKKTTADEKADDAKLDLRALVASVPPPSSEPEPAPAVPAAPLVAGATSGTPFEWPPSTRLSYTLTGDFRGPVEGSARVEWLRQGGRYQVHLDVAIGPSFAPLVRRRMSSEGELTEQGLKPTRYEEETRVPLAATRRKSIAFETDRIVLQGPKSVPLLAGVQDTASQFVQLTWLFTTQPQQLRTGGAVVVPLALPHRVDRWTYDVMGEETLDTPAGRIPTYWIKPRRENWKPGELAIEAWFAPSLQYLPVRIMIRQDAQTYADLMLQRLPEGSSDDDWVHVHHLVQTRHEPELLSADAETLLRRLFNEDTVRVFEPRPITLQCQCSHAQISAMLLGLGEDELKPLLVERGRVDVTCEFCGKEYGYREVEVRELFAAAQAKSAEHRLQ